MSSSKQTIQIPDKFSGLFEPKRYKVYFGGRGGAKSWNFARTLISLAYTKNIRILCTREFQSSIADSVHALISDQITMMGLDDYFEVKRDYIQSHTGSLFIFAGLRRDPKKVKSTEGIDIAWVEEADTISNESLDLLIPTIRKPGSEIWFSFNPDQESDPVYKRFVLTERDDTFAQKISYRDNKWFPDVLKTELEWDKKYDFEKYQHIWEGECRAHTDAQVFHGKYRIDSFTAPDGAVFYYGADWGFSQDPTTLVRCFIDDGTLYIDYEAYGVGVDIDATPELFRQVPGAVDYIITADSARPETISYMRQHGFPRITRARKGAKSIEDGISFLRSFREIVIHNRCKHTADEFKLYSYKRDRLTGDVLPTIEDKHNHCIDSLRYATERIRAHGSAVRIDTLIRR